MRYGDAVASLAEAMHRAVLVDLPDVEYVSITPEDKKQGRTGCKMKRRPWMQDVEVYHFPQTWGDTSLGFGGVGGQSFTTAYTTVVISQRSACVYFDGLLAYRAEVNTEFMCDLQHHQMAHRDAAWEYRKGEK